MALHGLVRFTPRLGPSQPSLTRGLATQVRGLFGHSRKVEDSAKEERRNFDVVIVGGGMIGSALGCALKHAPLTSKLSIAVVDRAPKSELTPRQGERVGENTEEKDVGSNVRFPDLRVSTLTPSTLDLLRQVGVGERIQPPTSAAFENMQIWDTYGQGFVHFSGKSVGSGGLHLGHVIENEVLKQILQEKAADLGCEFIYGDVSDILLPGPEVGITKTPGTPMATAGEGDGVQVLLNEGETALRTPLVIGADGANSFVAKKAGIRSTSYNYGQRAVTCTVRTSGDHSTAFQRFLSTGPIALLPVRDGFSNIVWSTSVSEAKHLEGLSSEDFAHAVNDVFSREPKGNPSSGILASRLSSLATSLFSSGKDVTSQGGNKENQFVVPPEVLEVVGTSQKSFPLRMKHAFTYCRKGVALVGDAAHSIHPLAGQGVNIGFGDVDVLVETLQEALWSGQNYADLLTLEKYSKKRLTSNAMMIRTLEMVKATYQSQFAPLAAARNLGMGILNSAGPLKDLVVGYASSNASPLKIVGRKEGS